MALNTEWTRKVEYYLADFPIYFTDEIAKVAYSGFVTKERLTFDQAKARPHTAFENGQKWGLPWEYAWMFGSFTVPESSDGKQLVLTGNNGECIVWVNGEIYGSIDREHKYIYLTDAAKAGDTYEIVMEVYAGHGLKGLDSDHYIGAVNERTEHRGERNTGTQKVYNDGAVSVWHEDIYKAYMDMRTLFELRGCLEGESQRTAEIDKALKAAAAHMNFELPFDMMLETVKYADSLLAPALAAHNGSSAATLYVFGHSHLDLEWLWTDAETRRKIARTVGNQLKMIKRYPEYRYLQSQPWLMDVLKNEYPELFEEFKKAVKSGNIIADGAMWVEPDLNVPSGESLIRQFMYGKKFLKEELGVDSKVLWVPDIFGCGCSLPQITKGCGVDYFFNAKLPWVYNGGSPVPRSTFIWRGIDGTELPTHIVAGYGGLLKPNGTKRQVDLYTSKEQAPIQAHAFGYSDGGGGAVRDHMEYYRRQTDLEGAPKLKMAAPEELFNDLMEYGIKSTYDGELYYCAHRGTYTSQAKTKLLNRLSELALREAEMASAIFGGDDRKAYEKLWKTLLFCQFHDILPGSSIGDVYTKAERELAAVVASAKARTEAALSGSLTADSKALTLYNTLSWDRKADIILPEGATGALDASGNALPSQKCADGVHVIADVPSCGTASITLTDAKAPDAKISDELVLENALIAIRFNSSGEITSITDKENGFEYLSGKANRFAMYADMPLFCDAWDIDSYYEEHEIDIPDITEVYDVTRGSLFSSLKIKKTVGSSVITQTVILREGKKQADFVTEVDWKETHKLLKVFFDTNINTREITSEMQFGHINRPAHRSDTYSKERFEVCQHKWSALREEKRIFAVLNDSKYGVGAVNGSMGVTLLKSAADPDFNADKGIQRFTYSIKLADDITDVVRSAWELNVPVAQTSGKCEDKSYFALDADNVIIDTVKCAEDGSGDIIVRLYECAGTMTKCALSANVPFTKAYITDMLENVQSEASTDNGKLSLTLHAFEVATVRLCK